ncbi:PE-PPE domain-containing protein [Mycobacterium malmoense]|uniref:PE family protein n=1 Tax=Mycobacterium malmoense TaxID=1780 RepID=A0ABX3T0J8_MYCMA|nr:PE-PPE domain-containing protein [Mycobacterium malmoense]ORA85564.1 PE family protein [Mycobacterium malmoense]QZA17937.1 PE-PPE domain-containing protein [Mycobacterium malmoense]UNB94713.1 PE-PPE domain-containing protein [Mycobacterium malmoense]
MTYVLTQPPIIASAAADVTAIGSAINAANETAAGATTGVVAAAGDEVSAMTATLFNAYAQEYQALVKQTAVFHDGFAAALAGAGSAYTEAEIAASGALGGLAAPAEALLAPSTAGAAGVAAANAATAEPVAISLILGASGVPIPSLSYVAEAYGKYISPFFTTANLQAVFTPEGLYPITGIKDLTLNISVDRGLTILNNALIGPSGQITLGNTPVNVFGYSQGAILAALELPQLAAAHIPTSAVNFVLVGNEMTPNGGLLARFPDLNIPSLGLPFYGGMASNTGYTVINNTLEYDGFADFPQYPIDFLSDLNAVAGIVFVHPTYLTISQAQIESAITLPTSPGYNGGTVYHMIPTQNLPLLDPLRAIPYVGNPLANLLQPDLRYLVNWGYGDPAYGWSTGPANVTTPFGLFPPLAATAALPGDLLSGAQQGIVAAANTLSAQGLPSLPDLSGISHALTSNLAAPGALALPTGTSVVSALDGAISGIQAANTALVNDIASAASTAYATLLPTADIATALTTTLPSYDANLFLNGISQAIGGQPIQGLINAIGDPIAANVGLGTVSGGVEFLIFVLALQTILTGAPHPTP